MSREMNYKLAIFKISVLAVALGLFHFAAYAHADQLPGSDTVCVAVFPCDLQTGELLPEYSDESNECYSRYRSQCDFEQTIRTMSDKISACEVNQESYKKQLKSFRKRVRSLRKKIRSLR